MKTIPELTGKTIARAERSNENAGLVLHFTDGSTLVLWDRSDDGVYGTLNDKPILDP